MPRPRAPSAPARTIAPRPGRGGRQGLLRNQGGGEVRIHRPDGTIRDSDTVPPAAIRTRPVTPSTELRDIFARTRRARASSPLQRAQPGRQPPRASHTLPRVTPRSKNVPSARDFGDRNGRDVIEHALASGWTDVVEAFWRYGDPQQVSEVADCVLRDGSSSALVKLIVEEIVAPTMDEPVPTTVMTTLAEHRARLRTS